MEAELDETEREKPNGRKASQGTPNGWPPGYEVRNERVFVRLPDIPKTESAVPWLTSLHASDVRGPYGNARFRGNCSGLLIRDLLRFYRPRRVLDPMTGSATCHDVCTELEIPCVSFDLAQGLDAADPRNFSALGEFDFVWLHPPYYSLIRYSDDPRCLSQAPTLEAFLEKLRLVLKNCSAVLSKRGVMAVLIGDACRAGNYWGLPFRTLEAAKKEGLWLAAPEIIRFGHGATSSRKAYRHAFIPLLHDVCWVLRQVKEVQNSPSGTE